MVLKLFWVKAPHKYFFHPRHPYILHGSFSLPPTLYVAYFTITFLDNNSSPMYLPYWYICLHQAEGMGRLCFAPRPSFRVSVLPCVRLSVSAKSPAPLVRSLRNCAHTLLGGAQWTSDPDFLHRPGIAPPWGRYLQNTLLYVTPTNFAQTTRKSAHCISIVMWSICKCPILHIPSWLAKIAFQSLQDQLSVFQLVCEQLISGTTGPIASKLCTHISWMPTMNLCPKFSR